MEMGFGGVEERGQIWTRSWPRNRSAMRQVIGPECPELELFGRDIDAMNKMLHGDTRTSKASPLKYLESFLEAYSPNVNGKFVVVD